MSIVKVNFCSFLSLSFVKLATPISSMFSHLFKDIQKFEKYLNVEIDPSQVSLCSMSEKCFHSWFYHRQR